MVYYKAFEEVRFVCLFEVMLGSGQGSMYISLVFKFCRRLNGVAPLNRQKLLGQANRENSHLMASLNHSRS